VTSLPSTKTPPARTFANPMIVASSVVLPTPLRPSTASASASGTATLTFSSTTVSA
jgi:hypothetical protein